jgi:cysteine desulfurase / selenocysteine lyase
MNSTIRAHFSGLNNITYLNSAAVSLLPAASISAVNKQMEQVAARGSEHYQEWVDTKERCRTLLAAMIGVDATDVAFLRNTSDGFSAIAAGIDWKAGDNIVSFAGEFPSNFYPWRQARDRHGVELRLVEERDGRIDLDEMISMIDDRTRVVAISSVQFASGFRADLETIGRAARSHNALFCVDLIQGLGGEGYALPSQFVDAACGASHKWLCSPEGCGYIYLSPRAMEQVQPVLVGWLSVANGWDFKDREQPFVPNAQSLENGTGPASLFYGMEQSLTLVGSVGLDVIKTHLRGLTDLLCERLAEKNYEIVSSRREGESSAIVCASHRGGMSANAIAKELSAKDIIVSPRDGRLRISPHFFNTADDIERLIADLP